MKMKMQQEKSVHYATLRACASRVAFTLIELIVSMLIFTIFIGVVSTSYLFLSRALRQAAEERKVYAEARLIVDKITQDVRRYTIDYDCIEDGLDGDFGQSSGLNECSTNEDERYQLPLISSDGLHRTVYRFSEGQLELLEVTRDNLQNQWIAAEGYLDGFQAFAMDKVRLLEVQFQIAPLKSPYHPPFESAQQYQPSVHVILRAEALSNVLDPNPLEFQSTISSRIYNLSF